MIPNHISEEKFQLLFDELLDSKEKSSLLNHVAICETCEEEFNHYKNLYSVLNNRPEVDLSNDFATNIIVNIVPAGQKKISTFLFNLFISIGILFGIGTAGFFTDFQKLIPDLSKIQYLESIEQLFASLLNLVNINNQGVQLFLMGAITLIIVGIIDKLIRMKERTTLLPLL